MDKTEKFSILAELGKYMCAKQACGKEEVKQYSRHIWRAISTVFLKLKVIYKRMEGAGR